MFVIFNDGYARITAFHFIFSALIRLHFNTFAILANFILTACMIACAAMVCIRRSVSADIAAASGRAIFGITAGFIAIFVFRFIC